MGTLFSLTSLTRPREDSPAGPWAHTGELVFPVTSLPTIFDGGSHTTMSHSESGHEWHNKKETSLLKEAYQAVDHVASGGHNSMPSKDGQTLEGRDWAAGDPDRGALSLAEQLDVHVPRGLRSARFLVLLHHDADDGGLR